MSNICQLCGDTATVEFGILNGCYMCIKNVYTRRIHLCHACNTNKNKNRQTPSNYILDLCDECLGKLPFDKSSAK